TTAIGSSSSAIHLRSKPPGCLAGALLTGALGVTWASVSLLSSSRGAMGRDANRARRGTEIGPLEARHGLLGSLARRRCGRVGFMLRSRLWTCSLLFASLSLLASSVGCSDDSNNDSQIGD